MAAHLHGKGMIGLNDSNVRPFTRKAQLFVAVSVSAWATIDLHQGPGFANNYRQLMNRRMLQGHGFDACERTADEPGAPLPACRNRMNSPARLPALPVISFAV